jgi:hypothetical protein
MLAVRMAWNVGWILLNRRFETDTTFAPRIEMRSRSASVDRLEGCGAIVRALRLDSDGIMAA